MAKEKLRHSTASYVVNGKKKLFRCDVDELAREYINWGEVPLRLNDIKAMEISLLAKAYLKLKKPKGGKVGEG